MMDDNKQIFPGIARAVLIAMLAGVPAAAHAAAAKPAAAPAGPRQIQVMDRIVAIINDTVITRRELNERIDLAMRQLRRDGTPLPPREIVERQLLDRLINDRVQLYLARETGLRVSDAELDRAVQRIADENKMSLDMLRTTFERDGVPFSKFREDIRDEITLTRLREREVDSKVVVTESEVDGLLAQQQAQQGKSNEFNLSHILITVPESASPEQIQERRQRIEQALQEIKSGADFRQVAATYSQAPDALQGGVLGWRDADRLPTIFLDALKEMKPGDLSPVMRSGNGFHILRLNEVRGAQAAVMVQQTRARHILIKTNELVSETDARNRLRALKERLENKANFEELARVHSEDSSASKGGDLGWIVPGDTVPEFERAMDSLQVGEISDPVRSPFGWHLIQVTERRSQDISRERARLSARQALRARKADEAYQEWARQVRDRAYVEIRLEDR